MGAVWIARNEVTGAEVALKVLRPDGKPDAIKDAVERFRYEARLGSMLHHRSITRVFDMVEESDGTLVLVMELLRGETLQSLLRRKEAIDMREAVAIAVPILAALEHAHDNGIIHRDVKPANIYLAVEPDGHVIPKLLDFGIAKVHAANLHTLEGRVLGTPAYMSPEQIRATTGELTGRSDLFSMGVVLYEMLTGAPPFDAKVPSAALAAVLEEPVDPDPRIDPRLWIELQRALSKRPQERHASAGDMAQALCVAVQETEESLASSLRRSKPPPAEETEPGDPGPATVDGHSVGLSQPIFVPRRTSRAWLFGAAAIIAALLVVTTVALTRKGPNDTAGAAVGASVNAATSTSAARAPGADDEPTIELPAPAPPPTTDTKPERTERPVRAPRSRPRPKPIATTPGF
jgi:eukaryotic-like serine/threonine-protein kinase